MPKKIAILTTITPDTHYSAFLSHALEKNHEISLFLYICKNEIVAGKWISNLKKVWSDNLIFPFEIVRQAMVDKPDVIHVQHEFRMFGGKYGALVFPLMLILLKAANFPLVTTIHWVVPTKGLTKQFSIDFGWKGKFIGLQKLFLKLTYFSIITCSKKVVVHTEQNKIDLVKDYCCPEKKCAVIPHGVPAMSGTGFNHAIKKKILYFGYVHPRKGIEELILAYKKFQDLYPDWRLVLAGGIRDKKYKEQIESLILSLGLSRQIDVLGHLSGEEIENVFEDSSFLVFPYKYAYSASGPLALAISHLKPVVVTPVGSLKQEILNLNIGFVTESTSDKSLCDGMIKMMQALNLKNKDECDFEKSLISAWNLRNWDVVANEHIKVFNSLEEG